MLGRDPPIWSSLSFDLTLVPPQRLLERGLRVYLKIGAMPQHRMDRRPGIGSVKEKGHYGTGTETTPPQPRDHARHNHSNSRGHRSRGHSSSSNGQRSPSSRLFRSVLN